MFKRLKVGGMVVPVTSPSLQSSCSILDPQKLLDIVIQVCELRSVQYPTMRNSGVHSCIRDAFVSSV